jgi:hypothetical protein
MTLPTPAEFLGRPNVIDYLARVMERGGRVILAPT